MRLELDFTTYDGHLVRVKVAHKGTLLRSVILIEGKDYVVEPIYHRRRLNRSRTFTLLEILTDQARHPRRAKVQFHDNAHIGIVPLEDITNIRE